MKRREFTAAIKVAVIKRATKDNAVYCECCHLPAKRFQIDHIIADSHWGQPVLSNAQLICDVCYGEKNPKDTTTAAKLKRIEAKDLGAGKSKAKIQQRAKLVKPPPRFDKTPLKPLALYRSVDE